MFRILRRCSALAASLLSVGATSAFVAPTIAAAQETPARQVVRDGSSPAQAAVSCWDIKQTNPKSASGTYWLLTSQMDAPQQFFCDQEMDGGGWVLIGRGREGWDHYPAGQGDPAKLTERTRTPEQFPTVQLSEKTVNGLLDGQAVNEQQDGFRVVRAADTAGSKWQNIDLKPAKMRDWTWSLTSEDKATFRFNNGPWYQTGTMDKLFGYNYGDESLDLSVSSARGYKLGFGYGSRKRGGSDSATNYLWSSNGYYPLPYAEVYLRPRLSAADAAFTPIPDSGLEASTNSAVVSSFSSPTQWGVTGNLNGRTREGNAPVQAFAQIDNTVFTGGNFTHATNKTTGEQVPRTAVAAFDSETGQLQADFSVELDGQVKALLALPNGKLLIGGDFTTAGGQPHSGIVAVDPRTGAIDESWNLQVISRLSSGVVSVKSLALGTGDDAGHIYIGGNFTHLNNNGDRYVYARGAGRTDLNGVADRSWNPEFNGTVVDIDTSSDGATFYAAGHFTKTVDQTSNYVAALHTAPGAGKTMDWNFQGSSWTAQFQQAIAEEGGLVFVGGAQHMLFGYDPATLQRKSSSVMKSNGGDVQAIAANSEVTYASCHCNSSAYQDAYTWPTLNSDWSTVDNIQWVGAWDSQTGEQLGEFSPYMLNSNNAGGWGLFLADDGALWVGGDFTGSRTSLDRAQWNGGWVRYPAQDRTAPETPGGVVFNESTATTVGLRWTGVADAVSYEILRDDRVVAVVDAANSSAVVPRGGQDRYFIRAVDAAGNRSATTAVQSAPAAGALGFASAKLIAAGAQWSYSYGAGVPGADWNQAEGDRSGWASGAAPLGYGADSLATSLQPGSGERPVTAWFAHEFEVADPKAFSAADLSYVADDGAVVYVNGREVSRTRMGEGTVNAETRASAAIGATEAMAKPTTVTIPSTFLRPGRNVVAVETHLNYRNSRTLTFDARLDVSDPTALPQSADPAATVQPRQLLKSGADWGFYYEAQAPDAAWFDAADTSAWATGATPIGWGSNDVATALDTPADQRARTAYFVKDLELNRADYADYGADAVVRISVRADDGALVRLNGQELGRKRLDAGAVDHATYANAAVGAGAAKADLLIVEVPLSQLRDGVNRLAVETHLNYLSTGSMVFDASAEIVEKA